MEEKTIEELEQQLINLKELNKSAWNTYGSELCAGEMLKNERKLEKEIEELKIKEKDGMDS